MADSIKLAAGSKFPKIRVLKLGGGEFDLAMPANGYDWRVVVIYRGKHCPICTKYLTALNDHVGAINEVGIDVVAVSGDPEAKARDQMEKVDPKYDVGYGLTVKQMQTLGLYVSDPRSPQETDQPFSEPALFVINGDGALQVVELANGPFVRPDLDMLVSGLKFIRDPEKNYPIRGTHSS